MMCSSVTGFSGYIRGKGERMKMCGCGVCRTDGKRIEMVHGVPNSTSKPLVVKSHSPLHFSWEHSILHMNESVECATIYPIEANLSFIVCMSHTHSGFVVRTSTTCFHDEYWSISPSTIPSTAKMWS
mmetsp:Transcript_4085/g.15374  ORF Transcript_4085/g.15374 Transcript_4085/m.15374 type:complete len:127 (+) Transcript_4085:13110-13490(+)